MCWGAEHLQQLDDGGSRVDAVGDGGSVYVEPRQVVHRADDRLDIGGGDEAGASGDHARGESFSVFGIGGIAAQVGIARGQHQGIGEVGGVVERHVAGGAVGVVERENGVGGVAAAGFGSALAGRGA